MPISRGGSSPARTLSDLRQTANVLGYQSKALQSGVVSRFVGEEYEQLKALHERLITLAVDITVFLNNAQSQYEKEERDLVPTEQIRCDQCHAFVTYQNKQGDCWRYTCPGGHETLVSFPHQVVTTFQFQADDAVVIDHMVTMTKYYLIREAIARSGFDPSSIHDLELENLFNAIIDMVIEVGAENIKDPDPEEIDQ